MMVLISRVSPSARSTWILKRNTAAMLGLTVTSLGVLSDGPDGGIGGGALNRCTGCWVGGGLHRARHG